MKIAPELLSHISSAEGLRSLLVSRVFKIEVESPELARTCNEKP